MTTATAQAPDAKRKPLPFADRVRLHPRAGDLFKATAIGESFWIEVELVAVPWVFYRKWSPASPLRKAGKVKLGAWRENLAQAKIQKVKP